MGSEMCIRDSYCIAVKKNQPGLYGDIEELLSISSVSAKNPGPFKAITERSKGHGREERRDYFISEEVDWMKEERSWPGLKSVGVVRSTRIVGGKPSYEERLYVCSFGADVEKFAKAVRSHWHIENRLHWTLDVAFSEDKARARKDFAAENLSRIRRISLNLLRKLPEKKSLPKKRLRCALDDNYRERALTGGVL